MKSVIAALPAIVFCESLVTDVEYLFTKCETKFLEAHYLPKGWHTAFHAPVQYKHRAVELAEITRVEAALAVYHFFESSLWHGDALSSVRDSKSLVSVLSLPSCDGEAHARLGANLSQNHCQTL